MSEHHRQSPSTRRVSMNLVRYSTLVTTIAGVLLFAALPACDRRSHDGNGDEQGGSFVSGEAFFGGPVLDAEMSVFAVDGSTGSSGALVGKGTTTAGGLFSVPLSTKVSGPIRV